MKGLICQILDYFVSIAVDKNGPVKKLEDLKGKTIGLPAIGGAPHLVTKAIMRDIGWDPEKDAQFTQVGTSPPALDAMRRDRRAGARGLGHRLRAVGVQRAGLHLLPASS